ncbi:MAG: hypothetical protein KKC99_01300 [Proteobacteria bacterium]|nr:hypothetical protein [Pseudomonadota bacterium]
MSGTKRPDTTDFVMEQAEIAEAAKRAVHGPKPPKPSSGRGNVFFIGPRGSGKTALGHLVAERLARPFTDDPDWQTLAGLVKQGGQVASIPAQLLEQDGVGNLLQRGGKVFYIMIDAATLAGRLGGADREATIPLREALFAELNELEPKCMQVLHFILPGASPLEELVGDVVEKLAITGDA